jgi:hypothetical protein
MYDKDKTFSIKEALFWAEKLYLLMERHGLACQKLMKQGQQKHEFAFPNSFSKLFFY